MLHATETLHRAMSARPAWPYPFWFAHRGAGRLAPENTLAAFRLGAELGWQGFECDVKLSDDDVLFLLHDSELERTSSGHGIAGEQRWNALSALDAGGWHSPAYAGEPLPRLEAIAALAAARGLAFNLEIKPSPGAAARTGAAVARFARTRWPAAVLPLLSSFEPEALQAAQAAAPEIPRALLLDALDGNWLARADALACVAVVFDHVLLDAALIAQAHAAGLRVLAYTVNAPADAQRLRAAGIDGLISDEVVAFATEARGH
jgi:glycerophosphoryl diester phosphodiesterase